MGASLPYFFDEVFALREYAAEDGTPVPCYLTRADGTYSAKDRSGVLDAIEDAREGIGPIVAKILGGSRG
jgi:hypothetical protein